MSVRSACMQAKYLPTGAILAFTSLSPLTTSNGVCGPSEWAVTGAFVLLMTTCTFLMSFTETVVVGKKHYYGGGEEEDMMLPNLLEARPAQQCTICQCDAGVVTPYGLWSPAYNAEHFKQPDQTGTRLTWCGIRVLDKPEYCANMEDFMHAIISTSVFLSLALLTDPVAICFWGNRLPPVVKQALPPIVAATASVMFSFFGPPRSAVGFPGAFSSPDADGNGDMQLVYKQSFASETQVTQVRENVP